MHKKAAIPTGVLVKLLGAVVGSLGFFFTAFGKSIVGAAFIGLGGVLLALGERVG